MIPDILHHILNLAGTASPDGRLLHAYMVSDDHFAVLQAAVQRLSPSQRRQSGNAGLYVLWAAERIRRHYDGGGLSWDFVHAPLPDAPDGTATGALVQQGLDHWHRPLRRGLAGNRLFLYTLLAEGGIPMAVLEGAGQHPHVLRQMIEDIGSRGGVAVLGLSTACDMAQQKMRSLPRVLQNPDSVALFVELAQAIFDLRETIPPGLPAAQIEVWLNRERPNWQRDLPLRVTPQIIDNIIRPSLTSERRREKSNAHPAQREIHMDGLDQPMPVAVLSPEATLPMAGLLADAAQVLRLLPRFATRRPLAYRALRSADSPGRLLERVGGTGPEVVRLGLFQSLEFDVMSDSVALGPWPALSALPDPSEAITLWAGPETVDQPLRLRLMSGGRTRAGAIWACVPQGAGLALDPGLTLLSRHRIDGADLVKLQGQGVVQVDGHPLRIATGADADSETTALYFFGKTLPTWRLPNGEPVYLGIPAVYGQRGDAPMTVLPASQVRRATRPGSLHGAEFFAWVTGAEPLALARAICLPATLSITAQETAEGGLDLHLSGLPDGMLIDLRAGPHVAHGQTGQSLSLPPRQPDTAFVTLTLTDIATGKRLDLTAPWPSTVPQFIRDGAVLPHRDVDLCLDDLPSLGLFAPGSRSHLVIDLAAGRSFSLPVSGMVPLVRQEAVLRKLLRHGNADNSLAISLHNNAGQTGRINLRRYHGQMALHGDRLTLGLPSDLPRGATLDPVQAPGQAHLHMTDIETGAVHHLTLTLTDQAIDLRAASGRVGGLWLVLGRFNGHQQRPVAWPATPPDPSRPVALTTRATRIRTYRASLTAQAQAGGAEGAWKHLLHLLLAARDGGDPAMLDQFHALADAPLALARMLFTLTAADLGALFTLDSYWSLFWPGLPVADLIAVARDTVETMGNSLILAGIAPSKAQPVARGVVLERLALLRSLRPDLTGHLALILIETGLIAAIATDRRFDGMLLPNPRHLFDDAVQTIARSDPALPGGIEGLTPVILPMPQKGFQRSVEMTIGTVLAVAEQALGLRSALSPAQSLDAALIEAAAPDLFGRALHPALLVAYSTQRT